MSVAAISQMLETSEMQFLSAPMTKALESDAVPLDSVRPEFITQLLAYAADAEQRIAEQQARIDELEVQNETDDLTGLLNRRGFMRALNETLEEAEDQNTRGLLVYIDLDGFKDINDSFGHGAGDAVLRTVGKFLRGVVRHGDHVARLGGDEFAVILTRSDTMRCKARIMELKKVMEALVTDYEGNELTTGASIGFKAYGPKSNADELVAGADKAMYKTKQLRKASA